MGYFRRLASAFLGISPQANVPGYEPGSTKWRTRGYQPSNEGPNALIEGGGDVLRAWTRDLARKNSWVATALDSWVANCIGAGIKPQFLHPDPAIKKNLSEWWKRWTDEADASGITDFYGLQALTCRSTMEAGETISRIRFRLPKDRLFVPLQLQTLEAEHLPIAMTQNLDNGNIVRAGIEYDQIGKRSAFHLYKERPAERMMFSGGGETTRVPAEYVAHNFKPLRPGMQRGQPWFAPVLMKIWELDQYDDAEVVRKKTAAFITYILEEATPEDQIRIANTNGEEPADDGTEVGSIEPGSTLTLPQGLKANPSQAADLTGQYEAFFKVQLHAIASALGLTYEQVTGDMTGVNYSSARIAQLEFRRKCEQYQHQVFVFQYCRPILKAFIQACVFQGLIDVRDYAKNSYLYENVEWRPPKWDWVDPKKDLEAEILAIDNLLKPRSDVINEMGDDEEAVDERIRQDQDREETLKLKRRSPNMPQGKTGSTDETKAA